MPAYLPLNTEGTPMKRYVTYRRVSTDHQGKSGLGLAAQDRDIRLYLEGYSEQPYEIIGAFTDIASGTSDHRPELTKAIALAKLKGAELLVAKLDRLSRKVSFISSLMDDKRLALRVASMPQADKFSLHIYAALAEQEREFISIRTKAALAEAKAKGKKLGGLRDKTMQRNKAVQANAHRRAEQVSGLILPLRAAGKSLREIAAELNKANVQTARGGEWQASQIKRVIARLEAV
jgi:DNA invertase Pin-like site-specific DNA recombinase